MRARLLLLLAAAAASPSGAAELNLITGVEVKDAGAEVVLSVHCSKRPSFTTFSMADPPRFVIDFSESKFQGVAAEIQGGGVIQSVKNLSYGSDASAIARVMVAFSAEVDPPAIDESPDGLVIRVAKPGGAAVAAAAPVSPAKADAGTTSQADVAAAIAAKAKADEAARAKADEAAALAARAKADEDARARADEAAALAARAKADEDARAKADEASALAARAKADEDARAKADQAAALAAKARADEDAKARADEAAALAAKAKADEDAKARADAAAKAKSESAAPAEGATEEEQRQLDREIAAAKAEAREAPRPASAPIAKAGARGGSPRVDKLAPAGVVTQVREVGFRQLPDVSRIFVRTSATPQYSVQEVDDRTVRIELENSRALRKNDLRFLDTSFFSSAVELITPSRQGTSYVLTVKLRQRVPYQQKVEGDLLAIDFQRPAEGSAGARPKGTAAASEGPAPAEQKAE